MARKYEVTPSKTYATEANVEKVVERAFPDSPELVYVIMKRLWRWIIGNPCKKGCYFSTGTFVFTPSPDLTGGE
jgi:hypothetical protein